MITDSRVLAIDPTGCGCTDCIVGIYIPLHQANGDQIQALLLGVVNDNTGTHFDIKQTPSGTFDVQADDRTFNLNYVALPLTVDNYTLDLLPAPAALHRNRLGARPTDTSPTVLGL